MRKPQGQIIIVGDFLAAAKEGGKIERDTITCGHCQQLVLVKPGTVSTVYLLPQLHGPDREEPGAMCRVCMRAVCLHCHDLGTCHVWERKIEEMEQRGRFLKSAGIAVLLLSLASPALAQVFGEVLTGVACTPRITSPTTGSTYDAGTATSVTLSGTASADGGVGAVTYTNSLGGSGTATGTTSWTIASVALTVGSNVITVSCTGPGSSGSSTITVTRSSSGLSCADATTRCVPSEHATIDACADAAVAGDTCLVSAGTYEEVITPAHNGTVGSPITIVANGTVNTCRFFFSSNSYIRVIGFTLNTDLGTCTLFRTTFYFEGTNTGLEMWNNTTTGSDGEAYTSYSDTSDRCNGCIIFGPDISGVGGLSGSGVGIVLRGSHSLVAYANIHDVNPDALVVSGAFNRALNLYVHDMIDGNGGHSDIMQVGSSTGGLSNNLFEAVYQKGTGAGGDEHFAQQSGDNPPGGMFFCQVTCGAMTENKWRRNVVYNVANGAGPGANQVTYVNITNTRIYFNTDVISNVLCDNCRQYVAFQNNTGGPGEPNAFIKNNLHYDHMHGNASSIDVQVYTMEFGTLEADYNLVYTPGKTLSFVAPWTSQANAQSNVNPQLVDAATGDAHVGATSGAIAVGGPLTTAVSCSGTTLNVAAGGGGYFVGDDSANLPQYGGALAPGDQITVNGQTRRVVSVSTDTLTLDASVTCSMGDAVFWGDDTTPDIGAYPYKAGGYTYTATYALSSVVTITPSDASLVRWVVCKSDTVPYAVDNSSPYTCPLPAGTLRVEVYPLYATASTTPYVVATP